MNHWMELLKKLRKENPKLSFKEILKLGKKTYKKSKKHQKKSKKHQKKSKKHQKKSKKHQKKSKKHHKKSKKHQKKSKKHHKSRGGAALVPRLGMGQQGEVIESDRVPLTGVKGGLKEISLQGLT